MSALSNYGWRNLRDQFMNWMAPGLPVYLRIKNFDATNASALEMGFTWTPPASGSQATGYSDVQIYPQPQVVEVPLRDIGLNQAKLMFGARKFSISDTWVRGRQAQMNYDDPYQVFRDVSVLGLYYNSRLFDMQSITHVEVGGQTFRWDIVGNALETKT